MHSSLDLCSSDEFTSQPDFLQLVIQLPLALKPSQPADELTDNLSGGPGEIDSSAVKRKSCSCRESQVNSQYPCYWLETSSGSDASGLYQHLHTHVHTHPHIHIVKNKLSGKFCFFLRKETSLNIVATVSMLVYLRQSGPVLQRFHTHSFSLRIPWTLGL